jgi:hypothetical protein
MANDIQTSLHGRRLGLGPQGELLINKGRGTNIITSLLYANAVASTALSNFTAQRAFDTYATVPANSLQPGSIIKIRYQGIQTAVNGTDTMQPILTIGGTLAATTLAVTSGTALLTATATAGATSMVFHGEYTLVIRTVGTTGTMVGYGVYKKVPAAEATYSAVDDILASTTIDTTIDQIISVGLVYGAASASNSTRLDLLTVEVA